nr:reverse transcriptase domain-containing protein [Tanacetum cinerariifolium]
GNDVATYTQRFQELALMCTKFLADEYEKVDKYINGFPDNIHGNVMSARPKTLDDAIELANNLMDKKPRTCAKRQNDNKRKVDDSSRNNQQQQPHKKQNVARAYTAGPGVNTIIRGCTLNFMNHPFNIDLMPVPLGSFDIIIGMDWLTKYHGVIIYDEKNIRVPFGKDTLIFQGNRNHQRKESRLNIISCTKANKYLSTGCDVFLAHITTKEAKDKSEGKRLEDVPVFRDFSKVFPKDLQGILPARQV